MAIIKKQVSQSKGVKIIGEKYPSLSVSSSNILFQPSHIEKYREVCGYKHPGIPLLYPAMLCSNLQMKLMTQQEFPFPLMGLVHLANSVEQYALIDSSKKVRIEISLDENVIYHEKGYCCNLIGKIFLEGSDQLLWKSVSTLLCRAKVNHTQMLYESQIKQCDVENAKEIERWTLASNLGRKYAAVSGDYNPIHISAATAYLFGFKSGAIIHGMWTKARSLALLMPPIEQISNISYDPSTPLASAYTEFKTPLFIPSVAAICSTNVLSEQLESRIFEVKGTTGDMLPYMRGKCSWKV